MLSEYFALYGQWIFGDMIKDSHMEITQIIKMSNYKVMKISVELG